VATAVKNATTVTTAPFKRRNGRIMAGFLSE
jgi:hypothetical protein